jgi:hypothetical protein
MKKKKEGPPPKKGHQIFVHRQPLTDEQVIEALLQDANRLLEQDDYRQAAMLAKRALQIAQLNQELRIHHLLSNMYIRLTNLAATAARHHRSSASASPLAKRLPRKHKPDDNKGSE